MTQRGIFRLFAKPLYEAGYPKGGKIGIGRLLKLFRPATEWKKGPILLTNGIIIGTAFLHASKGGATISGFEKMKIAMLKIQINRKTPSHF
jgi:hypothetical protein